MIGTHRLLLKQGLDWDWTGDGLEVDWSISQSSSFLTHLNIYFHKVTGIIGAPCSLVTWMLALCEPMELAVNCELDHVQY